MNKKFLRFIFLILIIMVVINTLIALPTYATSQTSGGTSTSNIQVKGTNAFLATVAKVIVVSAQVIFSGWFVITLSINGIQYFTVVSAEIKSQVKEKLRFTLFLGILGYLGMYLFSYAIGL